MYCNPTSYAVIVTRCPVSIDNNLPKITTANDLIQLVTTVVCKHYVIPDYQVLTKSRKRESVLPRQIIMFLCTRLIVKRMPLTLKNIGSFFSVDHTTVIYARKNIFDLIDIDKKLNKKVIIINDNLIAELKKRQL